MTTIQSIQFDLINTILKMDDIETLKGVQDKLNEKVNVKGKTVIPTVEVTYGISLHDIRSQQRVQKMLFEDVEALFADEEWDASLEELLVD
jgi:hypothetical protein